MGFSGKIRAFVLLLVISGILIWLVGGGNLSLFSKMMKGEQKDIQATVKLLTWVLGTELKSSGRSANTLNY